jgi:hypothetical protein
MVPEGRFLPVRRCPTFAFREESAVNQQILRAVDTAETATTNAPHRIAKGFLSFRRMVAVPFYLLALIADLLCDFFGCVAKKIADDKW